jgi:drug/metabolite transporter (DMT)-like permease
MRTISENLRGSLLMTAAMAAFVLNDTAMKAVSADLSLFQAILLRGLLTVAGIAAVAPFLGGIRFRMYGPDRRRIAWRTLGEVAGTVTFLMALQHMPLASLSAILQSLPLAVTLAAALVLGEPVGWRRLTAILAGFVGVLLIVKPGTSGFDIWSLLGLVSVGFVVLRDLSTRLMSRTIPSATIAFVAAVSVTAMAACVVPFQGWGDVTLRSGVLVGFAAACLVAGYILVVSASRIGDVAVVAPSRYTALLFAASIGWLAFGDVPDSLTILGATIVVLSGLYTLHRERVAVRARLAEDGAPAA